MPGNSGPAWTGTYPVTEDAGFAPGGSGGYTWQQVRSLLAGTDPGAISAAGAAYGQLSSTLTSISSRLAGHGQTLAANWGGSTAVTAVSQVQQLYQTAADLQANTWAAQQSMAWYGPVLETFRSSLPQPASSHPADVQAANQAAQQRMAALNSHLETAYYQMPAVVNKNLPPPLAGSGGPAGSGGSAAGGSGAGRGVPASGGARHWPRHVRWRPRDHAYGAGHWCGADRWHAGSSTRQHPAGRGGPHRSRQPQPARPRASGQRAGPRCPRPGRAGPAAAAGGQPWSRAQPARPRAQRVRRRAAARQAPAGGCPAAHSASRAKTRWDRNRWPHRVTRRWPTGSGHRARSR